MLQNNDVVSIQKDLMAGNYQQLLSGLRRIGRPIKQTWLKSSAAKNSEKYNFTSNSVFKEFLIKEIEKSKIPEPSDIEVIPQYINQLKNQLSQLAFFLMAWKDDPNLTQESETEQPEQLNLSETEKKKLRQQIKFKSSLDKDDRYAINIALQTIAFILCQQTNNFIKYQEKLDNHPLDFAKGNNIEFFLALDNKQKLIDFIFTHIGRLNKFKAYRYPEEFKNDNLSLSEEEKEKIKKQQEIEKIGQAIAAFQTPNKKKKLLKYFGIFIALIASLACGLATGGAIFLLGPGLLMFCITLGGLIAVLGLINNFGLVNSLAYGLVVGGAIFLLAPSLPVIAIILGGLTGLYGFRANFGFFSKNFPDFLLSLLKKGGISEYIDVHGKRKQFSAAYKYLFTPLTILASLTVGAGTTALTYITVLSLVAKILPILAIIWPPLPLIIVGVLAAAVGIALTVAVLTASLDFLKKAASLNLGFKELCAYAYNNSKEWFKNLKNLKTHEKVGIVIMLLLLPVALAGLAYFRYTAGVDLSVFIGKIGAIVMGIVAYIPQMAFTYLSINKFKNILTTAQQADDTLASKGLLHRVKSVLSVSSYWLGLTINAGGNALLVYDGSALSAAGAAACGLNSLTGNMSEPDMNRPFRNSATDALVTELENFDKNARRDVFASTSDSNLEKPENSKPNIKNLSTFYPQEPENINLPSPTRSEDGLITMTSSDKYIYTAGPSFFSGKQKLKSSAENFDSKNLRVA